MEFINRKVRHPNRKRIKILEEIDDYYLAQVKPDEGIIDEPGTALNAKTLNSLNDRIESLNMLAQGPAGPKGDTGPQGPPGNATLTGKANLEELTICTDRLKIREDQDHNIEFLSHLKTGPFIWSTDNGSNRVNANFDDMYTQRLMKKNVNVPNENEVKETIRQNTLKGEIIYNGQWIELYDNRPRTFMLVPTSFVDDEGIGAYITFEENMKYPLPLDHALPLLFSLSYKDGVTWIHCSDGMYCDYSHGQGYQNQCQFFCAKGKLIEIVTEE